MKITKTHILLAGLFAALVVSGVLYMASLFQTREVTGIVVKTERVLELGNPVGDVVYRLTFSDGSILNLTTDPLIPNNSTVTIEYQGDAYFTLISWRYAG